MEGRQGPHLEPENCPQSSLGLYRVWLVFFQAPSTTEGVAAQQCINFSWADVNKHLLTPEC